jgi:protein-S-isoprenylcysteine O-methyltransferase Ste14
MAAPKLSDPEYLAAVLRPPPPPRKRNTALSNRIPPPILVVLSYILMWLLNDFAPFGQNLLPQLKGLAMGLFSVGLIINLMAAATFRKAQTTINPLNPEKASSLIDHGVFSWSRNPIYLAMAIMVVAGVFWTGNILNFVVVALFVWFITKYQIKPEEKALEKIFGDAFDGYCSKVRRWI